MAHLPFARAAGAVSLVAALVLAAAAAGQTRNPNGPDIPTEQGFDPATGQINPGEAPHPFSKSDEPKFAVPSPKAVRDALKIPDEQQPSAGESEATGSVTPAGAASAQQAPRGPIGSFGQTIPSKYSKRNAVLDRVPSMALPLSLSDAQRKQIFDAVMADKSAVAEGADLLTPSSELTTSQVLDGMHPFPAAVASLPQLKGLKYVKAKNKILLVDAPNGIVLDQIPD